MARLVCALLLLAVASASASEGRIVGGWPTTIEKYPSMVQIQRQFLGIWTHTGAGLILTSRAVLTVASNFRGPTVLWKKMQINAGSTHRSVRGQLSGVARVISHPTWFEGINRDGDIAVVILETPLQYSNVVQQGAILGQGVFIPDNMPSVQLGWGVDLAQPFPHVHSDKLLFKDVYTYNNQRCAESYANAVPSRTITSNMLCAGGLDGGGACYGDRGGALMINDVAVAVVAFGWSCTNASFPAVHTAIPSYTDWIVNNVS